LGYAIGHESHLTPWESAAERNSFGDVVLAGRLRDAMRRLTPVGRTTLCDTLLAKLPRRELSVAGREFAR
jgi:hypothetical protein